MKKFMHKVDAICAKLKQGLVDGEPINGISHNATALAEPRPTSSPTRAHLNGCEAELGGSPCLNSSFESENQVNGFPELPDATLRNNVLNGHVETSKALCGASKRKARLKLTPCRIVDSADFHEPTENGFANNITVNGDIYQENGGRSADAFDKECSYNKSQESTSTSTSMQISSSHRDNCDLAENQGNNHVHKSHVEGADSDRSSLCGDTDNLDTTQLWYANESDGKNADFYENSDSDSLEDIDPTETRANLSSLKAIQEYAERSLVQDQPIEEGLATNDVICEVHEDEAEVSPSTHQNVEHHPERNMDSDPVQGDTNDQDFISLDTRAIALKIPLPAFHRKDRHYDASVVQEYASDMMNELIGLYGFEEGSTRDIAKDVPLDSFSFKNIQKMEQKNASKHKNHAFQQYIRRRANLHVPNLARLHTPRGTTSPNDETSPLPNTAIKNEPKDFDDSTHVASPSNLAETEATPQLASQAGVGGKIASLPPSLEALGKLPRLAPPVGKTTKTVKDLIKEQKGREGDVPMDEIEDDLRPKRFSKYDFFIQSLEAGQAIDYSSHRVSKYDSYIRKLKAGEAIHKVIGRKQSASQKIRDIISTQIQRKHEQIGEAPPGDEEEEVCDDEQSEALQRDAYNAMSSNYASKYDYFLDKLRKGEDLSPFEISPLSETTSETGATHLTNGHGELLDYTGQSGELDEPGNLVIAEEHEQKDLVFDESPGKRNISNGTAKMVKDEITPGEMNVFSKYITRYSGSAHCGHLHCVYQFKEHYHCIDEGCSFARFTRKEDVVRHYNWHKRRDNSLQHGFMRFSPSDNCGPYYPECTINLKHTHYHCLQSGCNKVYTSTSDVLTHENFHKKNMSLINEGFQRFRATEDCGVPSCTFYGHKTTHFHCRRPGCDFVFKNKCDIEKHKSYHVKDDIYRKDGFKKFSKHEKCKYTWCKYSNNTNHFHCIRKNCGFVFTAANQMQSHKRKHDRRQRILEYEAARHHQRGIPTNTFSLRLIRPKLTLSNSFSALRRLRDDAPDTVLIQADGSVLPQRCKPLDFIVTSTSQSALSPVTSSISDNVDGIPSAFATIAANQSSSDEGLNDSLNLPVACHISPPQLDGTKTPESSASAAPPPAATAAASIALATAVSQSTIVSPTRGSGMFASPSIKQESKAEEPWQKYLKRFTANDPCRPRCELIYKDHYHCKVDDCGAAFKLKDGVNKHARYHMLSDEASDLGFQYFQQGESCEELFPGCSFSPLAHYHCMWSLTPGIYCGEVVHTGSSLMRPHYEKHKINPELESIRISAVSFAEAQAQAMAVPLGGNPASATSPGSATSPSFATYPTSAASPSFSTDPTTPSNPSLNPTSATNPSFNLTSAPDPSLNPTFATNQSLNPTSATNSGQSPDTIKLFTAPPVSSDLLPSATSPGVAPGEGFITCEPDVCTVEDCPHQAKQHYHCTRGDCQFATENKDMLRDHKVNESVIFQSFKQMSRKMDCRRSGCKYNLLNKHYHCLHQGCNFSFLQIQQMESHGRKHMRRIYGKHFNKPGGSLIGPQQLVIPMVSASSIPFSSAVSNQIMFTSAPPILALPSLTPSMVPVMSTANATVMNTGSLGLMSVGNMGVVNSVGVPIQVLNSAGGAPKPLPPFMIPLSPLDEDDVNGNQQQPSLNYNGYQPLDLKRPDVLFPGVLPQTVRKRSLNLIEEDPGAPSGYKRYKRGPLDSVMMDRFRRYDRSETCSEPSCQFNLTTTHYHCLHEDCSYRFAGKTMMYKHAQHHDRVNSIIQNDFRRFKANNECEHRNCPYQGNCTHFHCLRCGFVCTDSGKVAVHRKQHVKTDTISAAGFRQYSSAEPCGFVGCKYTLRYSHFHCTREGCVQGVIGMTQMETHRRRHLLNVRV